jgi:hypothetical protein
MRKYLVRIFAIASILIVVGVISLNFSFKLGIMVIVNLWIAILLHELGHAVVGKLGGLSIVRFHVGPVQLDFRTGRRRIFVLRGNPFLGVVTLDPECKSAEDAVVAYRRAIIAGSLTSFAFAIGFLWLWFVSIGTGAPHLGLHWFGFVNAVLAL